MPRALVKQLDPDADARGRADTVQAEVKPENPKRQTDPEGKERGKKSNRTGKVQKAQRKQLTPQKVLTSPSFCTVCTIYTLLMSVKEPPPIVCSLFYHKK